MKGLGWLLLPALAHGQFITTLSGTDPTIPFGTIPANAIQLGEVAAVARDSAGRIYFSDSAPPVEVRPQVDRGTALNAVFRLDPDGTVRLIAGNGLAGYSGDGGPAVEASLNGPAGLAVDSAGNLYIADRLNHRIRKVDPGGVISTVAGTGVPGNSGDGGPAQRAQLHHPSAVAVGPSGELFVADSDNHRVRRISGGTITTFAGVGTRGFGGDGGPATSAALNSPSGLAVDAQGGLLIADTGNQRIRRVLPQGEIRTLDGPDLITPVAVAVDEAGTRYIAEFRAHRVRRVSASGESSFVAGTGEPGRAVDGGPASNSPLAGPLGVVLDASGNLYIADSGNRRVRQVAPSGTIRTVAGGALGGTSMPTSLALDRNGNVLVVDTKNHRLLRVALDGATTAVAGTGDPGFAGQGSPATAAQLYLPVGVATDTAGNIFLADAGNHRVRRISASGAITTVAGNGQEGFSGDGGPATAARLHSPSGVALDAAGNLYIADTGNHRIRLVTAAGTISTIAGIGIPAFGGDNAAAVRAAINSPTGIFVARATPGGPELVWFSDTLNHRIRRFQPGLVIQTIAGTGEPGFSGDGGAAAAARVWFPTQLLVTAAGDVFFADRGNHRIRRITASGVISTVAGNGVAGFRGDGGPATLASLSAPSGVAMDSAGGIYIADTNNGRVRRVLTIPPAFEAPSVTALTFNAVSQGSATAEQSIVLRGGLAGLPFTAAADVPWLEILPRSGRLPATLRVRALPEGLQPGEVQGRITITVPGATPASRTVPVTFRVAAGQPPRLGTDTRSLTFFVPQDSAPTAQEVEIRNLGSGNLSYTWQVTTDLGRRWLGAEASGVTSAAAPSIMTITATPAELSPGTYRGRVTIAAAGPTQPTQAIDVTMVVAPARPRLRLSQSGLTFESVSEGGLLPQSFAVANAGRGTLQWRASVTSPAGNPGWLSLHPAEGSLSEGSDPTLVEVTVNPAGLAAGEYFARIDVLSGEAANSPQSVVVALNVRTPGSQPSPDVRPAALVFRGPVGSRPGGQWVLVSNPSATPVRFTSTRAFAEGADWFVHTPVDATVTPETPARILVQPDFTGLSPGTYRGTLTLAFANGVLRTISVVSIVAPAPAGALLASSCAGTQLNTQFTQPFAGFRANVGQAASLEVRITDECGQAVTAGTVVGRFSNNDPLVNFAHIGDGRWRATWTPRTVDAAVRVVVTSILVEGNRRAAGSGTLSGQVANPLTAPRVDPGGVVSAASFTRDAPVAPGSLVTVFGAQLAETVRAAETTPLPVELAGGEATLGGRPLSLLFASDGQMNAQIPTDLQPDTEQHLIVRRGNALSVPETILVASALPAVFTRDASGTGQGIIIEARSGRLAEPGNPARPGDTVIILAAGLGAVNPPVPAGTVTTGLSTTLQPVSVTIGQQPAPVAFAGLAPGFVGVYQVNAVVPATAPAGDSVELELIVSGLRSPAVTMAVAR